jgi:hypothetical protein
MSCTSCGNVSPPSSFTEFYANSPTVPPKSDPKCKETMSKCLYNAQGVFMCEKGTKLKGGDTPVDNKLVLNQQTGVAKTASSWGLLS